MANWPIAVHAGVAASVYRKQTRPERVPGPCIGDEDFEPGSRERSATATAGHQTAKHQHRGCARSGDDALAAVEPDDCAVE